MIDNDKELEWATLLLAFPNLDLKDVDGSYTLIIDLCEHFNRSGRDDLWKDWLSLHMGFTGPRIEFANRFSTILEEDFGITG